MEGAWFARLGLCPASLASPLGQPHAFFYFPYSFLLAGEYVQPRSAAQLLAGVQESTSTQKKNPKKGLWLLGAASAQRLE